MNIFILSENPVEAANMHCDQHLGKMILESAQMLSTALHSLENQDFRDRKVLVHTNLYKPAYQKHPCTLWTGESYANFLWLIDLAYSLQAQLPKRHSSTEVIKTCELMGRKMRSCFPCEELTPFALAMPEEIKYNDTKFPTATAKYHELYKYKALEWRTQGRFMTYSQYGHRPIPEFIKPVLTKIG